MSFLRQSYMRERARERSRREESTIEDILRLAATDSQGAYDIFLSQTIRDAEIVLGVYDQLTELGFSVFCDWVDAPQVDRSAVTPDTADFLRKVMQRSASFVFLDTEGADQSLWMSWEIGWFDGQNGHVAVLPVLQEGVRGYRGREFLGIYPYLEIESDGLSVVRPAFTNSRGLTVLEAPNSQGFESWRQGGTPFMRPRNGEHQGARWT